jgi:hypothetical protein
MLFSTPKEHVMKKVVSFGVVVVALIGVLSLRSHGQNEPSQSSDTPIVVTNIPRPATKLEAMSISKGALLVKGYTDIGTLTGEDGSTLRVTAVEITDQARGARLTGIAMQISGRNRNQGATSFIDSEDVKSLLDAIDSLEKVDHSVTKLADFESSYRTRGDLEIANLRTGNGRIVTLSATQILSPSGQLLSGVASFRASRLVDLRQAIAAASDALAQSSDQGK